MGKWCRLGCRRHQCGCGWRHDCHLPALISVGINQKIANATNTVGLCLGSLAGAYALRQDLTRVLTHHKGFLLASLLGGISGAGLLILTPAKLFAQLVPWLILLATLLFALQESLKRNRASDVPVKRSPTKLFLLQLMVGIYGGYFGAGIGILMLALLGGPAPTICTNANALKNMGAFLINSLAALVLLLFGLVNPLFAVVVAIGAIIGSYACARIARRLPTYVIRFIVLAVGILSAGYLFFDMTRRG